MEYIVCTNLLFFLIEIIFFFFFVALKNAECLYVYEDYNNIQLKSF